MGWGPGSQAPGRQSHALRRHVLFLVPPPSRRLHNLFQSLTFLYWVAPLLKSVVCVCVGLYLHSLFCFIEPSVIFPPWLQEGDTVRDSQAGGL